MSKQSALNGTFTFILNLYVPGLGTVMVVVAALSGENVTTSAPIIFSHWNSGTPSINPLRFISTKVPAVPLKQTSSSDPFKTAKSGSICIVPPALITSENITQTFPPPLQAEYLTVPI